MAEETQVDGVTKLRQLVEEFGTHKARLQARGIEIGELVARGQLDDAALRQVVVEQFLELHDTALSLQADLAQVMLEEYEGALAEPDAAVDEPYDDDDSLLLKADAAQLRRTTQDYLEMLTAMVERYENEDRRNIEEKIAQAKQSLTLIDEIEEAGEEEAEDDEADDDEDDAADGAEN